MKTNYIKRSLWLIAVIFAATTVKAQTSVSGKTAYNDSEYNSYDRIRSENGKQVELIQSNIDDKVYKVELVNGKMTELYVDGAKIPAGDWDKYTDAIAAIKEQIKRNKEQAIRNEEQARLNKIQEKKNEEQVMRNEEQARLNQLQEKKNEEQAVRNEEQARLNQIQEKKNEEQVVRNQEQVVRNREQAVRNGEQARLNEIQEKKNEEQAKENERFIKEITADLVADKIIPDGNSLKELTFNGDEMIVNGVKQSAETHQKYLQKYGAFIKGSFNFSNDVIIRGN